MNRNAMMMWGCVITAAAFCAPAGAQKMYRCGSTYQETPCTGNQQGKEIRAVGPASSQSASSTDAACAQRGAASQKIVWAREAGATAEKALADVESKSLSRSQKEEEKRLIACAEIMPDLIAAAAGGAVLSVVDMPVRILL